jgi:voltage-gated potassium channel
MTGAATPSRARLALVLLRALLVATLIVAAFYVTPFRITLDVGTLIRFVVGIAAIAALIIWQLRAVARSRLPVLRAVETLAMVIPLFLVVFAATYTVMSEAQPASFSEAMERTDALYFTVTVFATVGFGDISPVSDAARIIVTVQMIADLLLLGLVLRALLNAVDKGRTRQSATTSPAQEAGDREVRA